MLIGPVGDGGVSLHFNRRSDILSRSPYIGNTQKMFPNRYQQQQKFSVFKNAQKHVDLLNMNTLQSIDFTEQKLL